MMAIYLVDYENVYIEGLQGIERLTEEDTLHIFYTQNRCGLTFGLYEALLACKASIQLKEVAVSLKNSDPVKNALDLQLTMFAGYLVGAHKSEQIFVVSKDKDFLLSLEFYAQFIQDESISLRLVPSVEASFLPDELEETEEAAELEQMAQSYGYAEFVDAVQRQLPPSLEEICDRFAKSEPLPVLTEPEEAEEAPLFTVQYYNTVRNLLGKSTDAETITRVCEMIGSSDTLVDFNNALARYYRDGQRAKVVYHKFKPRFEDLRHLYRSGRK